MAAFEQAWRHGADGVECDVHLTCDGHLVCCHDKNTRRTTGTNARIASSSLGDIQSLDAGGWKHKRWKGETIPSLRELMIRRPENSLLFIEVKCGTAAIPVLTDILQETGTPLDAVTLISFKPAVIRAWRQAFPQGRSSLLLDADQHKVYARQPEGRRLTEKIAKANASGGGFEYTDAIGEGIVKRFFDKQLELHVWNVNEAHDISRCLRLGVRSITTDDPALACGIVNKRRTSSLLSR